MANRLIVLSILQLKSIVRHQRNLRLLVALQSIAKPEKTIIILVRERISINMHFNKLCIRLGA